MSRRIRWGFGHRVAFIDVELVLRVELVGEQGGVDELGEHGVLTLRLSGCGHREDPVGRGGREGYVAVLRAAACLRSTGVATAIRARGNQQSCCHCCGHHKQSLSWFLHEFPQPPLPGGMNPYYRKSSAR